jgi:hypothetical protein
MMGQCPPTRSRPGDPPLKPLDYCWRQHWVDCCLASSNCGPLRPRPHLSQFFLIGLALAPHKGTSNCATIPNGMRLAWTHGEPRWERAKPLEGSAAAHFGCVCLLFLLYTLLFSHPYIPSCTQGCTTHKYSHVVLKIWLMLYFHGGNCTSVQRNLNTLPQKCDVEGVFSHISTMLVVHRVVHTTFSFVSKTHTHKNRTIPTKKTSLLL